MTDYKFAIKILCEYSNSVVYDWGFNTLSMGNSCDCSLYVLYCNNGKDQYFEHNGSG